MRIITLTENLAYNFGLRAEHGLSLYIETGNSKILFDTGQSGMFIQNAKHLGIDIADIDTLVLSHGHYDHTGGLSAFVETNGKAAILAKEGIFSPKYSGHSRFIGTDIDESVKSRVSFVNSVTQLDEDVFVFSEINIYNPGDTNFSRFYTKEGNSFYPDEFPDELFIVIRNKNKISIFTACSHRGITNICASAADYFSLPLHTVVGGFHMKNCTEEQYRWIAEYLQGASPDSIGVCHCTGVENYSRLNSDLDSRVFYNYTGNEIVIE